MTVNKKKLKSMKIKWARSAIRNSPILQVAILFMKSVPESLVFYSTCRRFHCMRKIDWIGGIRIDFVSRIQPRRDAKTAVLSVEREVRNVELARDSYLQS